MDKLENGLELIDRLSEVNKNLNEWCKKLQEIILCETYKSCKRQDKGEVVRLENKLRINDEILKQNSIEINELRIENLRLKNGIKE